MSYFIGIDAGTSNVKAVLFDYSGNEIHVESLENDPIYIGDTDVEQNMNILWEKVALCLRMLLENGPAKADDIKAIGVTGQGEGCWLIDEAGEPVQDALLWCDGRASDEVAKVTKVNPELGELIYQTTGTPPLTGTQLMLLKWMKENRKAVLDKAQHVFFCKDWVRYKLTGKINGDYTDTGTSLIDARAEKVADEMLTKLGLADYISYIPEQVTSDTIVGTVDVEVARSLGLNPDTPVIAGAIDVIAAAVGIGTVEDKDICVILGTTCANEIFKRKADCNFGEPGTRYEKHAVGDLYVNLLPTMNGTPNIDWALENISQVKDFSEIDHLISQVPVGSGGVIYHPYISAAGERAPFYHPFAKANFFGVNMGTTRAHLLRAVYEGITMSIKDCLQDANKNSKIFIAGGGAKSTVWVQMISDITAMEVVVSIGNEFGAKGAAMMAGVATGVYADYADAAKKTCKFAKTYQPNPRHVDFYQELYELYRDIRMASEPLWTKRAEILKKYK
ncbi:FGGY-family carbohydrate kinase [Acetobacterium carbinolicum]|uniref:FGGY-family carbohydrate kinase n=1 Tax=Acetobacterium carbinolicum TaxID=52690 RepID=UPI0039BFC869